MSGESNQELRKRNLGRLDHVARKADRASFPASFGQRFCVFVDTEEEFDWSQPQSRSETAVSHVQHLPEFQAMAEAHGVAPCYLVDWPVADTESSATIMRDMVARGTCSVGTQLHPWVNPPFDEQVNARNSFVGNLPRETERAKLIALTERIEANIGQRPRIYRAGRYGVGPHTAELLVEAGYRADTSIRPYFDYSGEGGPDFRRHSPYPSWAGPDGSLLELPLSVAYVGRLRQRAPALTRFAASRTLAIAALARTGMLSRVALTPEDMPAPDAKRAIDALLDDGLAFMSISFHSPSIVPGHTPYVRNSADLSQFYDWWDAVLEHLKARGVQPASVDEVIDAAWAARAPAA